MTQKTSTGNEVEKEEDPRITHGVHPKKTNPGQQIIYVPEADRAWVHAAKEQLKLDGGSLSAFTVDALRKWWKKHDPGNPQVRLDRYREPGVEKPKNKSHWRPGWNTVIVNGKFKEVWIAEE